MAASCFVFTRWKFDSLPVSSDDIVDVGAGDKKYFIHLTDVLGESHKNRYFTVRLTVRGGFWQNLTKNDHQNIFPL